MRHPHSLISLSIVPPEETYEFELSSFLLYCFCILNMLFDKSHVQQSSGLFFNIC